MALSFQQLTASPSPWNMIMISIYFHGLLSACKYLLLWLPLVNLPSADCAFHSHHLWNHRVWLRPKGSHGQGLEYHSQLTLHESPYLAIFALVGLSESTPKDCRRLVNVGHLEQTNHRYIKNRIFATQPNWQKNNCMPGVSTWLVQRQMLNRC